MRFACSFLLAALCAACVRSQTSGPASASKEEPPPNLPISLDAARATALARVPGQVTEEEVEQEDGRWVYEFDIQSSAGAQQEVTVDATTGQVVEVEDDGPRHGN